MVEDGEDFPLSLILISTSTVLRSPQDTSMWDFQGFLACNLKNLRPENLGLCQLAFCDSMLITSLLRDEPSGHFIEQSRKLQNMPQGRRAV